MGFRGNRGGTQGKPYDNEHGRPWSMPIGQRVNIRKRNFTGSARESELLIVPMVSQGEQSLGRGKGQYFYHVSEEVKERGLHRACWKLQKRSGNFRGNHTGRPSRSELRKPLEEDNRKAVFGKTERTV